MMENKIIARNLCKEYRPGKPVLKNVNFTMEGGHIYGFVAPNGAGKTTLMRCIAGLGSFTGEIDFNGIEVGSHFNNQIVYSSSAPLFENSTLKVTEYLHFIAILRGVKFSDVLEKFRNSSTSHLENSICEKLSTGEKKLFQLFLDLLMGPQVILLDEPLNGLDHETRHLVTSNLSSLAQQGRIILVSTHIFSDIEDLTDEVFVIKDTILSFHSGGKISEIYEEAFPSFGNREQLNI